jgi:ferrous iron transport protein A
MAADQGPTPLPIALDALPIGRVGTVARVAGNGAGAQGIDLVRRLMELGFLPGEPVRVLHRAFPSGDPLAVRIGNSTFALRRFEAALVAVTPA